MIDPMRHTQPKVSKTVCLPIESWTELYKLAELWQVDIGKALVKVIKLAHITMLETPSAEDRLQPGQKQLPA